MHVVSQDSTFKMTVMQLSWAVLLLATGVVTMTLNSRDVKTCTLRPLGTEQDDTDQIEAAIAACGHGGNTIFEPGQYNITRSMTWELESSTIDLHGYLNFKPDVEYWLNTSNTYQVVFVQNQTSWFVITGSDFIIDAHNTGGIWGNGQVWWDYFTNHSVADHDSRPISFTLSNVTRGIVRDFRIEGQPSWCNTVANSRDVVYDGMYCNATNTNPAFAGENIVPNTDGINTYRSDNISMLNWDITCGDDCLAIKGNSTNILARNLTCRGGNGIAVGSIGQYATMPDIVDYVEFDTVKMVRLPSDVQPNMQNGVYFKTWTGTTNGIPPTGGGGGGGYVSNVISRNIQLDTVKLATHLYQTNGGHSGDAPSQLRFSNLSFINWTGTSTSNKLVDLECSSAVPCPNIVFQDFNVAVPNGQNVSYICKNVVNETGLSAPCNSTGKP